MYIKIERLATPVDSPDTIHLLECDTATWETLWVTEPDDFHKLKGNPYGAWTPFAEIEQPGHSGFVPRGVIHIQAMKNDELGRIAATQEILLEDATDKIVWIMNNRGDTIQKIMPPSPPNNN
jgi:hypothetical protein